METLSLLFVPPLGGGIEVIMEKSDFKMGQKVYLKIIKGSNAARHISKDEVNNLESWIKEGVVTAVGKKYITVRNIECLYDTELFDATQNFMHYYGVGSADYVLYLSKDDILQDMECEKIYSEIKNLFSLGENERRYTLDQLQKVKEILK